VADRSVSFVVDRLVGIHYKPGMSPRPLSPEKRDAILKAAQGQFTDKGFALTRIADIAAAAGVGKGTVYEYFPSKEEILLEACLHACARNEAEMNQVGEGVVVNPGGMDGRRAHGDEGTHPVKAAFEVLRSVLTVLLGKGEKEARMFAELLFACADHPELMERARAEFGNKMKQWMASAAQMGEVGIEAGFFRPIKDYQWAARLIVAAVDGLIMQRAWIEQYSVEDVAHNIAATWCRLHLKEPDRLDEFLT
jgi:AcrR family transcriptional regulator